MLYKSLSVVSFFLSFPVLAGPIEIEQRALNFKIVSQSPMIPQVTPYCGKPSQNDYIGGGHDLRVIRSEAESLDFWETYGNGIGKPGCPALPVVDFKTQTLIGIIYGPSAKTVLGASLDATGRLTLVRSSGGGINVSQATIDYVLVNEVIEPASIAIIDF